MEIMENEKYNVYEINCTQYYNGYALVAAENVNEANNFIEQFKKGDSDNYCNSTGYSYVDETDVLEDVYSERKGIIKYGIYYSG